MKNMLETIDRMETTDTNIKATVNENPEPKSDNSQVQIKSKKLSLWKRYKFPLSWKEVKKAGWKFVVAFFIFYLIRDTILYIIIPYLIYKGVISF